MVVVTCCACRFSPLSITGYFAGLPVRILFDVYCGRAISVYVKPDDGSDASLDVNYRRQLY